jgi:hypothetical protein
VSVRPGSENTAEAHQGPPGTWDALCSPQRYIRKGEPDDEAPARRLPVLDRPGANHRRTLGYRHANHKEARRDGGRESERLIVPLGAGEPGPRGPCRGKGVPRRGAIGGPPVGGIEPREPVHVTPTDSVAACETVARRAGCLSWARPDLWEGREAIPSPTRPTAHSVTTAQCHHSRHALRAHRAGQPAPQLLPTG